MKRHRYRRGAAQALSESLPAIDHTAAATPFIEQARLLATCRYDTGFPISELSIVPGDL